MARSPDELRKLIANILEDVMGVPAADVLPERSLVDDLDVDSLAMVEIVVALEEETGVKVPDDAAKQLVTVQDVADFLAQKGA